MASEANKQTRANFDWVHAYNENKFLEKMSISQYNIRENTVSRHTIYRMGKLKKKGILKISTCIKE